MKKRIFIPLLTLVAFFVFTNAIAQGNKPKNNVIQRDSIITENGANIEVIFLDHSAPVSNADLGKKDNSPNEQPPIVAEVDSATRMSWEYQLYKRLSDLAVEASKSRYSTGIYVYDLTGDSLLFSYNGQKLFRPASTQKLLTSISALDLLGKDAQYHTTAYVDGRITNDRLMKVNERNVTENVFSETLNEMVPTQITVYDTTYVFKRVLHGNIYLKGTFDPLFTTDDLHDMAREIGKLDFDVLDGELIGDISMKDSLVFGHGWCWDDMPSSYVPWLTPLIFNEGIQLKSKTGNYMKSPDMYFLENVATDLRGFGKEIPNGSLLLSFQPTLAERGTLVYRKTHTVEDVLQRMMKKSNNQFAESMFYLVGYNNGYVPHPVTAEDVATRIMAVMEKAGCTNISETTIADGSGLSLYDLVTAENEVLLLRHAYMNKQIFEPLYNVLPIAGVDGTLEKRMKSGPAHKNVHAKTGTVSGVSTLAGYVRASNGNMLAFSIMNNGLSSSSIGRAFQDKVCQALAK